MRTLRYAWLLLLCLLASCGRQAVEDDVLPIVRKALSDTSSVHYVDFSDFPMPASALSIGVFDDDMSGLSVVEAFMAADHFNNITGAPGADGIRDFAGENFVYLADVANADFNEYARRGNLDFLRESVVRDALFLLDDAYYFQTLDEQPYGVKPQAKLLVCANPAASTFGSSDVETLLERTSLDVPVYNVVDAAVNRFLTLVEALPEASVGIMAEPEVVDAGHYEHALRKLSVQKEYNGRIRVYNQKTSGYVFPELVLEEERSDLAMTLISLLEKYRKQANGKPLQAIVVAFPHSAAELAELEMILAELRTYKRNGVFLYQGVIAENFCFIDPAAEVARMAYETLRNQHRLALRANPTVIESYMTMPGYGTLMEHLQPDGLLVESYRYGRAAGTEVLTTKAVPMAYRYLSLSDLDYVQALAPSAYKLIVNRLY